MKSWLYITPMIGLGVAGALYGGTENRLVPKDEFVSYCTGRLTDAGLPSAQTATACGCIYGKAEKETESEGTVDGVSLDEFQTYVEICTSPLVAEAAAKAAWDSEPRTDNFQGGADAPTAGAFDEPVDDVPSDWGSD